MGETTKYADVDEINKFMDEHFVLCTMKKDEKGLPVLVRTN